MILIIDYTYYIMNEFSILNGHSTINHNGRTDHKNNSTKYKIF